MKATCDECGAKITMHELGTEDGKVRYVAEYSCRCKIEEVKRRVARIAHMENEKSPSRTDKRQEF